MSATGRNRHRPRHGGRRTPHDLIGPDGELTLQGEHWAEDQAQLRAGYWEPAGDDGGPDGFGWGIDSVNPDSAVM